MKAGIIAGLALLGRLLLWTWSILIVAIIVEQMDAKEGMLLLLRRAKVLTLDAPLDRASATDRAAAESIVKEMDGLPLALDQAGAYIEETQCSISDYLISYQQRQAELLKQRGGPGKDHPESVATTWSLSFEQVERLNPMAADLLRVCAFLAPDAIPEELFVEGATRLGPLLQPIAADATRFDDAIGVLLRYSLLKRNTQEHTLSIHRLFQTVLIDTMDEKQQRLWAERAVRALNRVFPEVKVETWELCQRYLSHAHACATYIDQWNLAFPEAARLLNQTGYYLYDRALYAQAEPLYQRALAIWEKQVGPEHPNTAASLNNLALLYKTQGNYEQAEPLYQRALAIWEKQVGPEHPNTAASLNNLAALYRAQGKYEQAEPFYQRTLAIREKQVGPEHPDIATDLNNLAALYQAQGQYEQAEPLYQRALAIWEKQVGPEHPTTATGLNNLAALYRAQGKYEQAEPLYQRALAIVEKQLGPQHSTTATIRENYNALLRNMRRKGVSVPKNAG